MSVFKDQYPAQLPAQAQTALLEWNIKKLEKDEKLTKEEHAEKIAETVRRMTKFQFPAEGERLPALPDQAWIIERFDKANHVRDQRDFWSGRIGQNPEKRYTAEGRAQSRRSRRAAGQS
jgi:hypothetical protein